MTFSYLGDPRVGDVAAVRFEIQDTDPNAYLLQDEEIAYAIFFETGVEAGEPATIIQPAIWLSGAHCLEALARLFAMQADTQVGQLKTTYSKQSQTFALRAKEMRVKGGGGFAPATITPLRPEFRRKQFDNPYAGDLRGRGLLPPMPN